MTERTDGILGLEKMTPARLPKPQDPSTSKEMVRLPINVALF